MTSFRNGLLALALVTATAALSGCNDTAATVVVVNGYGGAVVQKVWWNQTLIVGPIDPTATSAAERAAPGSDFAYALISLGWPPAPEYTQPIALRSMEKLSVARGAQLTIDVFDTTFAGNCAATTGLDAATAAFITERIFTGDFAGGTYDAAGCETIPSADAGSD